MDTVSEVHLYTEPRCGQIDFDAVADYLRDTLAGITVHLKSPFFEEALVVAKDETLPQAIAGARIRSAEKRVSDRQKVLPGEIEYEARRLRSRNSGVYGLLYDAEILALAGAAVLSGEDARLEKVHIIVTNQLIGTWDIADNRYHARVLYCGSPAIISVPGMVEAPARDRDYYLARRSASLMGLAEEQKEELAREYAGDYLKKEDERMTEIMKGYALQPVAYRISGDPFCDDRRCRMFNAHWQKEMLDAQLSSGGLCERHRKLLGTSGNSE